jgi:uncharacterized protein (DUF952 family)
MSQVIYKVVSEEAWQIALDLGIFLGAAIDLQDGFIHLSTKAQVQETVRLHFRGQDHLLLVAFQAESFGNALEWEPSRGGSLFPHLYGALDPRTAVGCISLPMNLDGTHTFPMPKSEFGTPWWLP